MGGVRGGDNIRMLLSTVDNLTPPHFPNDAVNAAQRICKAICLMEKMIWHRVVLLLLLLMLMTMIRRIRS